MILSENTTLTGHGIGELSDAVSCIVTHEINGQYELMMTYPVTGLHYDELEENRIIWAEPDNMSAQQAFRIYRITRPLNGIVTVYARHLAYDMSGIIVEPHTASTLQAALSGLPSHCLPSCPFTFTTSRSVASPMKVSAPTALWSLLGGQQGSFLDVYGGEWAFDNYAATLTSHLGADRGVSVRYGKNLTELEQDLTIEATYVGVYPYWYDEETDTLVNLPEKIITTTGIGSRILLLDFTSDFENAPTVAQLRSRANQYITANNIGEPQISWKISFAQIAQDPRYASIAALEQVQLGDTIHVFYEPMELEASARAVKIEYDVIMRRYKSVTLGRVKQNLAAIVAGTNGEIQKAMSAAKSAMDRAIEGATDFITNGSGYMRFIYVDQVLKEIVSLDNPDINLAQKVWRWNNGGFGFSSTGYNGTYTTAITQDGSIVADFITTGTLTASLIKAGILADEAGKFSLNLDTGELSIEQLDIIAESIPVFNLVPMVYYRENASGTEWESNGITWTVNPDGTVTAEGTATADSDYYLASTTTTASIPRILIDPTRAHTYSGVPLVTGCQMRMGWWDAQGNGSTTYIEAVPSATRAAGYVSCTPYLRVKSGTALPAGGVTFKPMLESGETAHEYTSSHNGSYAMQSQISQNAENISLKVSQSDYNGNTIASLINQTATTVDIEASHINLTGAVTISSLDSTTQAALLSNTTVKTQYYLSTSTSSATGGTWYDSPNSITWQEGKYVWTRVATTKTNASGTSTTSYSTAVYDKQLTTALSTAASAATAAGNAQTTANGTVTEAVPIYYRSMSSTTPTLVPGETYVYTTDNTDDQWSTVSPRPKKSAYFWEAVRYTLGDGSRAYSPVRALTSEQYASKWVSTADSAYIDGGSIYANSVTADKISVSDLNALNATIAGWSIGQNAIYKNVMDGTTRYQTGIYSPSASTGTLAFYVEKKEGDNTPTYPFAVRNDGHLTATDATITGSITATSLTLGTGVSVAASKVSGLSTVATSGSYTDLSSTPDLTVYVQKDGTIGTTPSEGVTGFKVSSAGLLTASNAVIYGTVYATNGTFSGSITSSNANITGGSIDIETTTVGDNKIVLKDPYVTMKVNAEGIYLKDASNTGTGIYDGAVAYLEAIGTSAGVSRTQLFLGSMTNGVSGARSRLTNTSLTFSDSNGDTTASISGGSMSLSDGTKTYDFGTTNGLFMYAGTSKYSALIWPDSAGAGRFILGDGTSTKWRTELTNSGLVFRDANDNVTAEYPSTIRQRTIVNGTGVSLASATSGVSNVESITLTAGMWIIIGGVKFTANATGYRRICLSSSATGNTEINNLAFAHAPAVSSSMTTMPTFTTIAYITAASQTYYLNARQNSGSTLTATGYMIAYRLA